MRITDIVERRRRELDQDGFERLLREIRSEVGKRAEFAELVEEQPAVDLNCIDCYRDGGCREHSQAEEGNEE